MGNKCIKCSAELTENNWARHCKDNWVNKCNACIRIEKKLYISEWRKKNPELNRERSERLWEYKSISPIANRLPEDRSFIYFCRLYRHPHEPFRGGVEGRDVKMLNIPFARLLTLDRINSPIV